MKKRTMMIYGILFLFLYVVNISLLFFVPFYSPWNSFATSSPTALVSLIIRDLDYINITSPLNQTYNFGIGENYTLDLNVSSNFAPSAWSYDLWDMRNNIKVNDSIAFSPNTTFNAVRYENKLVVYAFGSPEGILNDSVEFFVNVPNAAPYFGAINETIYICEDDILSYDFNVTDVDEDILQLSLTPTNPFFIDTVFTSGARTTFINLFSGIISDSQSTSGGNDWRNYSETIEATDQVYSDTAYTNITAIRINDVPVISNIGVQTIYPSGEDSTFYYPVQVVDEEDGDENSGNLGFNISFLNSAKLFNISNFGVMNFTPNGTSTGVYNITICVNDTGLSNPHSGIAVCGQDGGVETTCQNFSLTITDENRAPTIVNYTPRSTSFSVGGTQSVLFNITSYDPDGTIPDAYWYVDGVFAEYDSGSLTNTFSHSFGCGIFGNKVVKAEITDGLLNDSISWYISVTLDACTTQGGAGGGGGGGARTCVENWVCETWDVCQHAQKSLEIGLLSGDDYRIVQKGCDEESLGEDICGVQTRECLDLNFCNSNFARPDEFQSCHYTENPSCYDGIKNCHDFACELLVDCGGPCSACPSCTDGIQNQGEERIDCGGPCPWRCEPEEGLIKKIGFSTISKVFGILLLIILIIILIRTIKRILEERKKLESN